jgi:hypothetical protein
MVTYPIYCFSFPSVGLILGIGIGGGRFKSLDKIND